MVMAMVKILLVATLFIPPLVSGWLKKKSWKMIATGKVTCDGAPMPYVQVNLMDEDVGIDQRMGGGVADNDGVFIVTGSGRDLLGNGKPDPYIKVKYRYIGALGQLDVVGNLKIATRTEKSAVKPYARNVAFGIINFTSMHCKAYVEFYKAMADFKRRAGRPLPYPVLYVETDVYRVHGGTPYATTNTVRIPTSWLTANMDFSTAQHELAHTVRHSLDGSMAHFLYDVRRFKYLRTHTCATSSNFGYAFNEGWSEFWENACHGVYGASPRDYLIEGNVAKGLRALKAKCGSTDAQMVDVLVANQGVIHSFMSYNLAHRRLYGCRL